MLPIYHHCLKEYNPQTAKPRVGQKYSKILTKELNKEYLNFFNVTAEAKCSLAKSLGITVDGLRRWMHKKWQEQRDLERAKKCIQTPYIQQHGLSVAGIL